MLAHELGHIKFNHANKSLKIYLPTFIVMYLLVQSSIHLDKESRNSYRLQTGCWPLIDFRLPSLVAYVVTRLVYGKRLEQEADRFAYHDAGKARGLLSTLKDFERREKEFENDLQVASALLEENKLKIHSEDRFLLNLNYYLVRIFYGIGDWIHHDSWIASHPRTAERIATIEKYLEENPA
jgi:Zn-dependent protease with chaperone function